MLYLSTQGNSVVAKSGLQELLGSNKHLQPDRHRTHDAEEEEVEQVDVEEQKPQIYEQDIGSDIMM